jgi:hypothetical protein
MTVQVADVHAHIQTLVSVVKMATMPEGFTTEEQRSFVRFFVSKRTEFKRYILKKYFMFTVRSVCRLMRVTTRW